MKKVPYNDFAKVRKTLWVDKIDHVYLNRLDTSIVDSLVGVKKVVLKNLVVDKVAINIFRIWVNVENTV